MMIEPEWFNETLERVGTTEIIGMTYDTKFFRETTGVFCTGTNYDERNKTVTYIFRPISRPITNNRLFIDIKHGVDNYQFTMKIANRIVPELMPEYLV